MAEPKPDRYPDWALSPEPFSPNGRPNILPVPEEFINSGLKDDEEMPRAYYNDWANLVGRYIRYLEYKVSDLEQRVSDLEA